MHPAVPYSPGQTINLRVQQRFRLPSLPGVPLRPRAFTATYYDTDGYRLAQAGIMLCYRSEQRQGVWVLTLPRDPAALQLEYAGRAAKPPQPLTDLLLAHVRGQALHPITRLRTRQSGVQVRDLEGLLADVRLNLVAALDGRRVVRTFAEVEITPTEARNDSALQRLEQALRHAGAADGDPRPLLLQVLGVPLPQPLPDVPPDAPLSEHLKRMLQAQVCALLRADPGTRLGQDPEELHQMRVATRRLRAYLRTLRPVLVGEWAEALRAELAWLGGGLGSVRDLDVLLEHLHTEGAGLPLPEQRALARLLPHLEEQRQQARKALLAVLGSERYIQLLSQLEAAAHAPDVAAAITSLADMAAAAFKRLHKAMQALEREASAEELHRLRIYGKRARYAAELAQAMVGKPVARFLQQAKAFQDLLGEHQDAMVAETQLRTLLRHTRGRLAAFTIGRLVERQQARRLAIRAALPTALGKLARRGQKAFLSAGDFS